jgi:DNA-binding XRE family transcriptional regulator
MSKEVLIERMIVMLLKLKAKRVEKGLTQTQLAKMIGIAPATYNHKENGTAHFSFQEIVKLLEVLECKFEDIFLQ